LQSKNDELEINKNGVKGKKEGNQRMRNAWAHMQIAKPNQYRASSQKVAEF
jgi:hypothetical protein